jgi:hypothetical protein
MFQTVKDLFNREYNVTIQDIADNLVVPVRIVETRDSQKSDEKLEKIVKILEVVSRRLGEDLNADRAAAERESRNAIGAASEKARDAANKIIKKGTAKPSGGEGGMDLSKLAGSSKWAKFGAITKTTLLAMTNFVKDVSNQLDIGIGSIAPAWKEANFYRERIREIVFETRGYGKENRKMEDSYFAGLDSAISASGVVAEKFYIEQTKNIERGLDLTSQQDKAYVDQFKIVENGTKRNLTLQEKQMKLSDMGLRRTTKMTTTALNTAKMLNMNLGSTSEMFMDWHMHLGLATLDLVSMGHHMQFIARSTGVTGERLERAIKSSESLAKSFQKAGSYSADTHKNIQSMMVSMEKYGVGEEGANLLSALSSRKAFYNASPETFRFMSRVAAGSGDPRMYEKMISGSALKDAGSVRNFNQGMQVAGRQSLSGFADLLGPIDKLDMTKLNEKLDELRKAGKDFEAGTIAKAFEDMMGIPIGVYENMMKASKEMEELSKPIHERVGNLQTQIDKEIAAGRGKANATNELRKKLRNEENRQYFEAYKTLANNELSDEVKKAQLENVLGKDKAARFQDPQNAAIAAQSAIDKLKEQATEAKVDFAKELQSQGYSGEQELRDALASKDSAKMTDALTVMSNIQEKSNVKEKSMQDNISDIREQLREWHNFFTGGMFEALKKVGGDDTYLGKMIGAAVMPLYIISNTLAYMLEAFLLFKAGKWALDIGRSIYTAWKGGTTVANAASGVADAAKVADTAVDIAKATSAAEKAAAAAKAADAAVDAAAASGDMAALAKATNAAVKLADEAKIAAAAAEEATAVVNATKMAGKATSLLGKAGGLLKMTGKIAGWLAPLIGGAVGYMEAEKEGRGKVEGTILGALTGGAGKGSMFSSWLGIEKGSTADEAMGIAGAAGTGAMTGAAIGSFILPGIGTAVGAGVGAVVGAGAELYKLATDEESTIGGALRSFGSSVKDATSEIASGSWILVNQGASYLADKISEGVSWLSKSAGELAASVFTGAKNFGVAISDGISNFYNGIVESLTNFIVKSVGYFKSFGKKFTSLWDSIHDWFANSRLGKWLGMKPSEKPQAEQQANIKEQNNIKEINESLKPGTKPGSFYVHDVHVEKILEQMLFVMLAEKALKADRGGLLEKSGSLIGTVAEVNKFILTETFKGMTGLGIIDALSGGSIFGTNQLRDVVNANADVLKEKEGVAENRNIVTDLNRVSPNAPITTGQIRANNIDYTDEVKNTVNPVLIDKSTAEQRLEQRKIEESKSQNSGLFNSTIEDYLTNIQARSLSMILDELKNISSLIASNNNSEVIHPSRQKRGFGKQSKISSKAMGTLNGRMDLPLSDINSYTADQYSK